MQGTHLQRAACALLGGLQGPERSDRGCTKSIVLTNRFVVCCPLQLDRIERFLVVHGQILLSQIKAYPNKDVQRSQFVTSLKQKMEARRHSKLYYSKRGFSKAPATMRAVNRNPMKVCTCCVS